MAPLANGSRDRPYRFGEAVSVTWATFRDADGSVWNTRISAPRDVGPEVLAENEFNSPPPDGVAFLGFDVSMTLVEAAVEPLSTGSNFTWELLGGATSRVYDANTLDLESFGCGVVPGEFNNLAEVFVGGTVQGAVCIPVPVEDLGDESTMVSKTFFGGERLLFSTSGFAGPEEIAVPSPNVTPVSESGPADGSRARPYPLDAPVAIDFNTFVEANGAVWRTTVGVPRDITAEVAAANYFNKTPPEGALFVGFDVSMTLVSADRDPLSPSFDFDWQILGGRTAGAYGSATLALGCGVSTNQFDDYAEVLVGGTLSGTICLPVPAVDLDDPATSVAMRFPGGDRLVFHNR